MHQPSVAFLKLLSFKLQKHPIHFVVVLCLFLSVIHQICSNFIFVGINSFLAWVIIFETHLYGIQFWTSLLSSPKPTDMRIHAKKWRVALVAVELPV